MILPQMISQFRRFSALSFLMFLYERVIFYVQGYINELNKKINEFR